MEIFAFSNRRSEHFRIFDHSAGTMTSIISPIRPLFAEITPRSHLPSAHRQIALGVPFSIPYLGELETDDCQ